MIFSSAWRRPAEVERRKAIRTIRGSSEGMVILSPVDDRSGS